MNIFSREHSTKHRRLVVQGGVAGLLIGLAVAAGWSARPYVSTAVLRTLPQQIPEHFVPAQKLPDLSAAMPVMAQTIGSRATLANLVDTHKLFPNDSMDKRVERTRRSIRMESVSPDSLRISFAHSDPSTAQAVTHSLVERFITEHIRSRKTQALMTLQFMAETTNAAAALWEQRIAKVREAQAAGQPIQRAALDMEIARRRYEDLSAKSWDAEVLRTLEERQQGQTLELLDPASLPAEARPSIIQSAAVGFFSGASIAWLFSVTLSAFRRRREVLQSA